MWEEVIGHDTVKRTLINALFHNKVAHAYLLAGAKGTGKGTLAAIFAMAYFCEKRQGTPCKSCNSCKKIMAGNYSDLYEISPTTNNIKIEQIREVQKACQYKPVEGRGKFYVIKNADTMTVEAANCLLKVLEEPASDTVFVLTTENPYALLPTVISRCQRLNLKPVPPALIVQWLVNNGVEMARAKVIASLSSGSPGKAQRLLMSGEEDKRQNTARKASLIQQGDLISVLRIAEELESNKETVQEELELLAIWYRDLLIWKATKEESLVVNLDLLGEIKNQALKFGEAQLQKGLIDIFETLKNLRVNANLRLSLETLLLKLMKTA